jgi:hypothetical protein
MMKRDDLVEIAIQIAKPRGYRHRRNMLWISNGELTRLLHFQQSRWGHGVYVNFGVTPDSLVKSNIPPGTGYWGLEMRATTWDGPFADRFRRCENDHDGTLRSGTMRRPIRWLLDEMDRYLSDSAFVRAAVLDTECVESVHASRIIKDWARGSLKHPTRYFINAPYYRRWTH